MALTKAQLLSLVATNLPDNITQQITPSLHRQVLNEAIDAMYPVPVQPVETIPAYNPLTTYEPGPDQYVIFNDLIWKFISATSQKGVEPGTNAAVWQEIIFNELAHIQNTDLKLGDYLALVEEDGPTIDMCDGAFSDSIYLVNNIFVFWPATNGAERPYSLKTVGTRRLTHTFIVMVHPSYLGSLKFESDANQVIGDEALILEPGEFAVFKGALGGPAIAAPKTQLLYKGGTMGPGAGTDHQQNTDEGTNLDAFYIGNDLTIGTERTLGVKGTESDIDLMLNTKGAGVLKSNALESAETGPIEADTDGIFVKAKKINISDTPIQSFILVSPDTTQWRITVSNAGVLEVNEIVRRFGS